MRKKQNQLTKKTKRKKKKKKLTSQFFPPKELHEKTCQTLYLKLYIFSQK